MPIITRNVSLSFDCPQDQLNAKWDTIWKWQQICHKAANWITNHQYIQDNIKDFIYLTEDTRKKLSNIKKDEDGILTTSRTNSTYQVLSSKFKGECPMGMLSGLNAIITKTYKQEIKDVRFGKKSLRSYRENVPMPVRSADISHWKKGEDGNYTFSVYGISFKTYFGKDLSGNEIIFDRAIMDKDYKFCDSQLQLKRVMDKKANRKKWRLFFLATFQFDKLPTELDIDKEANCFLDPEYPIKIETKKNKFYCIGTRDEYLYRRIAIRARLSSLQRDLAYTNGGGSGRAKKMQAINRFKEVEKNYINTKMHGYSRQLIDYCIKNKVGKIVLKDYDRKREQGKEEDALPSITANGISPKNNEPCLRSWSFGNLAGKIAYKAAIHGIEIIVPKDEKEKEKENKKKVKETEPVL